MRVGTQGAGFWITPADRFFRVTTHIAEVICAPERFGIDADALRRLFEAHDEPLGHEGAARVVVITALVQHGWIRVRHYPLSGWTVNVADLSDRNRGLLTGFFCALYRDRLDFETVKLD